MRICYADTETFCETPIQVGTHRYAEKVEITVWAYAFDDGPVTVWDCTADKMMPADLSDALADDDCIFMWHNAAFDVTVLHHNDIRIPITRHRCTMAQALAHGLPGSLDKLGDVLGIAEDQKKLKDGKALVLKFCKPLGKASKLRRATRETHPVEWARFLQYAGNDIEALRAIHKKLPKWNYGEGSRELALWHLDQTVNNRGIQIDLDLAHAAINSADRIKDLMADRTYELTDGDVGAATQRDALIKHILEAHGIEILDMTKASVQSLLDNKQLELPDIVRELLEIRLGASRNSTAKYAALIKATSSDGRLRGTLQFCGASRTGRWAGRIVQPQNFARPPKYLEKQYDFAIEAIKSDAVELIYDNPMEVLGACIRGALVAPEGKKFCISDLSNIEGRVLAWAAGETWKINAFRDFDQGIGADLYKLAYAKAFGIPVEDVNNGDQRQIGKVMELACLGAETLVLTQDGYKPIVNVKVTDTLWDGQSWVRHQGLVAKGVRRVVDVRGIKVTPDHLIKTGRTWTPAQQLALNESTLSLALATGSENLPLFPSSESSPERARAIWRGSSAPAAQSRIWSTFTTFAKAPVRVAMAALRNRQGTGVKPSGNTLISFRTMPIAGVCLTGYLPVLSAATTQTTRATQITEGEGFLSLSLGARISGPSYSTSSRSMAGIAKLLNLIGRKSMAGMNLETYGSLLTLKIKGIRERFDACRIESGNSTPRMQTFDIAYSGPRNCFTVLSDRGPLIVHNCGYAGGVGAFVTFATAYNIDLDDMSRKAFSTFPKEIIQEATRGWEWAEKTNRTYGLPKETWIVCDSFKRVWRYAHPEIVAFWAEVESAAKSAVAHEGTVFEARTVKFVKQKAWLRMMLPSTRSVCYPSARGDDGQLSYMGVNQFSRKWSRLKTYSGKLVENGVQAIARDVMAHNMPAMEKAGYLQLISVHDEIISEVPNSPEFSSGGLSKILSTVPPWAPGLPLAAAGYETFRYRKG